MIKEFLNNLDPQGKDILDVGSNNGKFTEFLKEKNSVKGIDIKNKEDVRTFPITKNQYNIIIARNVLPFLSNKEEIYNVIQKMYLGTSEYLIFTLFGENDPWAKEHKHMTFLNGSDIERIKTIYPVYAYNYFNGPNKTMTGDTKEWEIYTFVIKRG